MSDPIEDPSVRWRRSWLSDPASIGNLERWTDEALRDALDATDATSVCNFGDLTTPIGTLLNSIVAARRITHSL